MLAVFWYQYDASVSAGSNVVLYSTIACNAAGLARKQKSTKRDPSILNCATEVNSNRHALHGLGVSAAIAEDTK